MVTVAPLLPQSTNNIVNAERYAVLEEKKTNLDVIDGCRQRYSISVDKIYKSINEKPIRGRQILVTSSYPPPRWYYYYYYWLRCHCFGA